VAIEINRNFEDRLIKLESKLNSIHVNVPSENQQVSFKFGFGRFTPIKPNTKPKNPQKNKKQTKTQNSKKLKRNRLFGLSNEMNL